MRFYFKVPSIISILSLQSCQGQGFFSRALGNIFGQRQPSGQTNRNPFNFRVQPLLTLDQRPRSVSLNNPPERPRSVSSESSSRTPRLANQLIADGSSGLQANQIDGGPTISVGGNNFGSGGECRHNSDCRGSESCVRRNGEFICTKRFCNRDNDCRDGRVCKDQKCRRCKRCRDD